jgi:hypothetical protein
MPRSDLDRPVPIAFDTLAVPLRTPCRPSWRGRLHMIVLTDGTRIHLTREEPSCPRSHHSAPPARSPARP